jgi:hypothetical protein
MPVDYHSSKTSTGLNQKSIRRAPASSSSRRTVLISSRLCPSIRRSRKPGPLSRQPRQSSKSPYATIATWPSSTWK